MMEQQQIYKINKEYSFKGVWGELNEIAKEFLNGEYEILFNNIKDSSKFPKELKFICFDWENLKVLIYKEPNAKVYQLKNYNTFINWLNKNYLKIIEDGLNAEENKIKSIKLFKDIDKHKIKELKKGNTHIKIGDFLNTCWGYDQTNIELFVIKKIIGKNYFIIQEVAQTYEEGEHKTYYNVRVGDQVKKINIPIKAFISNDGYMSICENGYKRRLSLTSLKEMHYKTNTLYGH